MKPNGQTPKVSYAWQKGYDNARLGRPRYIPHGYGTGRDMKAWYGGYDNYMFYNSKENAGPKDAQKSK